MKQIILIINLITFLSLHSFGQTNSNKTDILWGPEIKASKRSTLTDIIGYDETGIYAIKTKNTGIYGWNSTLYLEHYNEKMSQSRSVELDLKFELEEKKRESLFEFIIHVDNEIYLFSSLKNQKKNLLFIQGINKKTLQADKNIKQIAEIDYSENTIFNSGNFNYKISNDSTKILIYYNLPYNRRESQKFGFHVFDKDMNQLWEKIVISPYKEALFEVEDYKVDNKGNVHLLGLIFEYERREKRKGKPNYKYQILSYYNNGNELKEYPVVVEGKFLTDMQIAINDNQDIICGGFYSSEGTFSIEGSYFLKINGQTKEINSKEFQKFGIDFITQNMTKKEEKKRKRKYAKGKNTELYQYNLDNIILKDDGGAILIGEQYFVKIVSSDRYTKYIYNFNDIIVVNMSASGKIEWTKKIAKKQKTINDGGFFSSYALSVVKDKLHFVFNDNSKNLFYNGEGKLHNFNVRKKSLVVLVTIDTNGEQTREKLFTSKDINTLTRPLVCEQISKNEMVLFGQKKKTHQFAKILFKE